MSGAIVVFAEIGYDISTVNDITTRANGGYGTFYHYFKNKQDLLTGLVDDLVNKLDDHVSHTDRKQSIY
ncbi:TetR/AcrR family transcriptional regulator [Bacillus sp. EB600]|uniref:TetR/AcrR family transcriptional regulator n=1 Tax=Bacillus sp. EB600 TaxID=2806345 RepID=UPI0035C101A8